MNIARIWGIPVKLHISWFLIFGLVTWSLAVGYFPNEYGELSSVTHWLLAVMTSILFFGSVLLHELGHAFVALRNQVPVRAVTLFIFGGVAQIEKEPRTPGAEFRIAIAGPVVSLALAFAFDILYLLDQNVTLLAAPSVWLARINLSLALFNLIPGFPLDGGRILRAIVWHLTGNMRRATQIAAGTGQLAALGFIGFGVWTLLVGSTFNGLWLIFIGWFLQNAAASSFAQVSIQESLRGVKVGQIMTQDCAHISGNSTLDRLVEERVLSAGERCFFVTASGAGGNGRPDGLLTLSNIAAIPRENWPRVRADEVMVPWERVIVVQLHTDLLDALKKMDDANIGQVPVLEGTDLVGLLSRERVLHYIRARAEIGG